VKPLSGACLVVALIGMAACESGLNPNASTAVSPTPTDILEQGYIAHGDLYVMFVQFDSTGQELSGTLYQASISPSGANAVKTESFSFAGTRQGDVIALSVSTGAQWTATLDSSELRLRYTDTQGLPAVATFTPSSIDAYDSSVQTEKAALAGSDGCTVQYPNHYASVTISGTFGGEAASQICQTAISRGYVAVQPDPAEDIVCVVASWGQNAVVVRDTGGQVIGSQICKWVNADHGPVPTWASTPATFY